MRQWFKKQRPDLSQSLFRPADKVLQRTDSIDAAIQSDNEHMGTTKRVIYTFATASLAASALGNANPLEVTQVWGQHDSYSGPQTQQTPQGSIAEQVEDNK